jgi:phosphatidylinositol N-acetylglucosaminyltransferase subunit H
MTLIEESLVVLRGLGIQTTSSSPTYLSTRITRFIPTTSIQDIFIHEAFRGFEVRFYLCAVVEEEEDSVVVFPVSQSFYCASWPVKHKQWDFKPQQI